MNTCGNCGKVSPDDAMSCSDCGTPLRVAPPSPLPVHSGEKVEGAPNSSRVFLAFFMGGIVGVLIPLGFKETPGEFSGTIQRDLNHDGRTDAWDTYQEGKQVLLGTDNNGDGRPDIWYHYENNVLTRWEEDVNFDGNIDVWVTCDNLGRSAQAKFDLDLDGTPETFGSYQFGRLREQQTVVPSSGQVWKKSFFTNGVLRDELIDRDRDGKFDERISLDVHGIEMKRERLK